MKEAISKNKIKLDKGGENETKKHKVAYGGFIFIVIIVLIVFFTPYSLAMIIVGSNNLNNCPIQNKIPIWLIVNGSINLTGVFTISAFILVYGMTLINTKDLKIRLTISIFPLIIFSFLSILFLFLTIWFFIGNAWTFSIYKTVQFTNPSNYSDYCDKSTYLFTFWTMLLHYILLGLIGLSYFLFFVLCGTTIACVARTVLKKNKDGQNQVNN